MDRICALPIITELHYTTPKMQLLILKSPEFLECFSLCFVLLGEEKQK